MRGQSGCVQVSALTRDRRRSGTGHTALAEPVLWGSLARLGMERDGTGLDGIGWIGWCGVIGSGGVGWDVGWGELGWVVGWMGCNGV